MCERHKDSLGQSYDSRDLAICERCGESVGYYTTDARSYINTEGRPIHCTGYTLARYAKAVG